MLIHENAGRKALLYIGLFHLEPLTDAAHQTLTRHEDGHVTWTPIQRTISG